MTTRNVNNSNNLTSDKMAEIYANQTHSDVILVVDSIEYPAHRNILCASSTVFDRMLQNGAWAESNKRKISLHEQEECHAVFEDFLKYFYTGRITLTLDNVQAITVLADKYDVQDLLESGNLFKHEFRHLTCKSHTWPFFIRVTSATYLKSKAISKMMNFWGPSENATCIKTKKNV